MSQPKRPYLTPGRLADVMALLQVLAFDEHAHRSENGLVEELQRPPTSGGSWTDVARQHPEFFRVRPTGDHVVSLLARHVSRTEHGRLPLAPDHVKELLSVAVSLHDRERDDARAWRVFLPLIGVAVGAALTWIGAHL